MPKGLEQKSVFGAISHSLTLHNAGKEIACAVSAVKRYNQVERFGSQFACWVDADARDCDRETLVNRVICMTRVDCKVKQGWW